MIIICREIIDYISNGPVLAMELLGDNAITAWKEFIGREEDKDVSPSALSLTTRYENGKYYSILLKVTHYILLNSILNIKFNDVITKTTDITFLYKNGWDTLDKVFIIQLILSLATFVIDFFPSCQ